MSKETHSFTHVTESNIDLTKTSESENEPLIIKHSSYHDFEQIVSLLKNNKNKFSIFSSNIQSLESKWNLFQIFIERLKKHGCYFNALCLQECWLGDNFRKEDFLLDGYEIIPQKRHCSTAGGLIIYLQNHFEYSEKPALKYENWEGQFINIKSSTYLSKTFILGNIYRCTLYLNEHYNEFKSQFEKHLKSLESNNTDVLIAGDFNIDLLKVNNVSAIGDYFDMLTSHSFYPKITMPTRFSNSNASLIDSILCKLTTTTLDTTSGVIIEKISDHNPCFTILNNIITKDQCPRFVKVVIENDESVRNFCNHLAESHEIQSLENTLTQDPNLNYNKLHNLIQKAKNLHLPEKTVKFNKHKHKKNKWISMSLIKSIKFRDDLYCKFRKSRPGSEQHHTLNRNLKTFNAILKKTIRNTKKSYYDNLFEKYKGDIKGTWKTINEILNRTKRKNKFPLFFRDGNEVVTSKLAIANHFNAFFTNIGPKLAKQIKKPIDKDFKSYLIRKFDSRLTFKNVDSETVNNIINELAPKSSCGFDGVSTRLLKSIKGVILKPITLIINQMLNTGIFPDKLKIAKVVPIYKKEDETLFTNYRPISIRVFQNLKIFR